LDLNIPFTDQKMNQDCIDVVYSVNTLHVANDLAFSLDEIYKVLRNKGILVISELIRSGEKEVLCQEFIFNLLESYYDVKLDQYLRPIPGFLTPEYWKRSFKRAGFKNIELITNTDYKDESSAESIERQIPNFNMILKGQKV